MKMRKALCCSKVTMCPIENRHTMTVDPVVYKEVCTIGTQTDDNGCNNGCTSMYINVVHVIHSTGESIQVVLDDSRVIEADLDNGRYDGEFKRRELCHDWSTSCLQRSLYHWYTDR
ncbi:hypothetical protein AC249_AIPGENE28329 [Exaiptasia diaphana]|nr:hypothetical protein AC249_AIPGENE28329 [Exaiptasia diaphana]